MIEDEEDQHGLQTTNLKKARLNFSRRTNREVAPLNITKQDLSAILRNGRRYIRSFFSYCHSNRQSISYVTCSIRHLTSTITQVIGWWVQTTSAGSQSATWLMTSILSRGKWSLVPTRIYNLWLTPLWNTRTRLIVTGLWRFSLARREGRVISSSWLKAGFH